MKDITEILKSLRNVRLDVQEKVVMRNRLIRHIDSTTPAGSPSLSWYSALWSHQSKVAFASLFITLTIGSTVVFAAEQALPGDILYPIKTKVTEKVERALAPSEPLQLAAFETKLVERRFEEAEKLDKKQLLVKEDTKSKARKEIEKQAEKAEKAIAKARISKQIEVAQDTMMMQSFSTTQNDSKEDDEVDIRKSKRGKSDDHRDDRNEQDSELEKVFKKHSNIVKKLDIKKNNRSYDDK